MKKLLLSAVATGCCLGLAAAVHATRATPQVIPPAYRFTGVVSPIAAPASHVIYEGDGFKFYFSDAAATVKRYRVCVYKGRSHAAAKCWSRRVRQYDRDQFIVSTLYPLPTGPWIAKWVAGGRVVTKWSFLYLPEGEVSYARGKRADEASVRRPTTTERSQILAAIKRDFDQLDVQTKGATGRIKFGYGLPRVSTVDRHWAAVPIRIWDANGQEAQPELAVLHKSLLTGRWLVYDIATAARYCYVPKAARRDLRLPC